MSQQTRLAVPSLFGGISQQPPLVRFPHQVEDASNVIFSVFNGATKRPGTIFIAEVDGLDERKDYGIHAIERDQSEKYLVLYGNGVVRVFEDDGREADVTITGDAQSYLNINVPTPRQMRLISIADYTFILNTTVEVATKSSGAGIDETTMPVQLVRTSAGDDDDAPTFTLDTVAWTSRSTGTNATNPAPSLWQAENRLSDISFHRNRLVLAGGENIVFSQAGDFFNFYIEDADNIVDSDPIDLALSAEEVTIIDFIVPFRRSLSIFTKAGRQFEMTAPEALTPTSASILPTTRYSTLSIRPRVMGGSLYFAGARRGSASIYEYQYDDRTGGYRAENVTNHVPHLLADDAGRVEVGVNEGVVITMPTRSGGTLGDFITGEFDLLTEDEENIITEDGEFKLITERRVTDQITYSLGVYRVHQSGGERQQSAWTKYVFDPHYRINDVAVVGSHLYILIEADTQWTIEAMPLTMEMQSDDPLGDPFELPSGKRGG